MEVLTNYEERHCQVVIDNGDNDIDILTIYRNKHFILFIESGKCCLNIELKKEGLISLRDMCNNLIKFENFNNENL